jgi:hypothetical protein
MGIFVAEIGNSFVSIMDVIAALGVRGYEDFRRSRIANGRYNKSAHASPIASIERMYHGQGPK